VFVAGDSGSGKAASAGWPAASTVPHARMLKYSATMQRSNIDFQARDIIEIQ